MRSKQPYGRATQYSKEYYAWKNAVLKGHDVEHHDAVWRRAHGVSRDTTTSKR